MALPLDVTDPGSVNISDQGFGQGVPAQVSPFGSSPASIAERNVEPGNGPVVSRKPLSVDQAVAVENPYGRGIIADADGDASVGPGRGVAADANPGETIANQAPAGSLPVNRDGAASQLPRTQPTTNVTQNNVAGQVYGSGGLPSNVNV